MGLVELILIALGLYIALAAYGWMADRKRHAQMREAIAGLPDFRCTYSHIGNSASNALAIDEASATICFLANTVTGIVSRRVPARDILTCEVVENRCSRTVQSGRGIAVMVGRFAVPVSRPRMTTHNLVNRVEIRITVNDPAMPLHTLTLLNTECADGGALHALVSQDANIWCARIHAIATPRYSSPRAAKETTVEPPTTM